MDRQSDKDQLSTARLRGIGVAARSGCGFLTDRINDSGANIDKYLLVQGLRRRRYRLSDKNVNIMKALHIATTSAVWLMVAPAFGQSFLSPDEAPGQGSPFHLRDARPTTEELLFGPRHDDIHVSYPLSLKGDKAVFGYVGASDEVALGPPASFMRRYGGLDVLDAAGGGHWLYPDNNGSDAVTVGYAWRGLKVERSVFSSGKQERPANSNLFKLDSKSVRLSYKPGSHWTFQLSRGSISGLDQIVPNEGVRRTTLSATYQYLFPESEWQTTLAWGRNTKKFRENVMGYLLESTYRFSGSNVVFGRLEQVASDELARENGSAKNDPFKLNKVTVGYFKNIKEHAPVKFDVGVLASRHLVPSAMEGAYGSHPVVYMAFIRLKPQ